MTRREMVSRYSLSLIGLFVVALGVGLVTKASLGTTPITSIPYVLCLGFQPTLGQFSIAFNLLLILIQGIMLGKHFNRLQLLQIPACIVFGFFVDGALFLLAWLEPQHYLLEILALLCGCVVLGLGVYLEVVADVVMLPAEAFVKAVTTRFHTDFGSTKVIFDATLTTLALLLSWVLFQHIAGVREGTVIAALAVGLITKFWRTQLQPLAAKLLPEAPAEAALLSE